MYHPTSAGEIKINKDDNIQEKIQQHAPWRIKSVDDSLEENGWNQETSYWKREDGSWEKECADIQNNISTILEATEVTEEEMSAELEKIHKSITSTISIFS